jgi:hypothetical protein
MLRAKDIQYELADRARGLVPVGIGALRVLARQTGLIEAIDRNVKVVKVHFNPSGLFGLSRLGTFACFGSSGRRHGGE